MVKAVAVGGDHSLVIKSDGSLWSAGYNGDGQLGDGTFQDTNRLEEIVSQGALAVSAGDLHSLFLQTDGSVWAMGDNSAGQLGDGTFNNTGIARPEEVISNGVVAIAAGGYHSLFIKSDGSLWATGANDVGQLGDGTSNSTNRPEQIVSGGVVAIAAGELHSLFLKADGSLWAMGNNYFGQLGDGTYNDTQTPEQIVSSGVVAVAAGAYHSLFIKADGSLWVMGQNHYGAVGGGQLGDGTFNNTNRPEQIVATNVVGIAGGQVQSLFLKSDGSLWGMGSGVLQTAPYNLPAMIVPGGVIALAAQSARSLL